MHHSVIHRFAIVVPFLLLAGVATAQEKQYEGDITAVNAKTGSLTVKATQKGEPAEMKFDLNKDSLIYIDGDRKLFAELEKGDRVTVTYETKNAQNVVKRADRRKTAVEDKMFTGDVIDVDTAAQTFTVRRSAGEKVEEMKFHASPDTRLYIGTDQLALLRQLEKGDEVTVGYETAGGKHNVKSVSKGKATTF